MAIKRVFHPYLAPNLNILECAFAKLREWDCADLAAPYWRLYWHSNPGGWIEHDGVRTTLTPDRLVVIAPNTPFSSGIDRPAAGTARVGQLYVHFALRYPFDRLENRIYRSPCGEGLRDRLTAAVRGMGTRTPGLGDSIAAMHAVCAGLAAIPARDWPAPFTDARVIAAIALMRECLHEALDNPALAVAVSMSTSRFIRRFSEQVGISPHQYLLKLRLDRAGALLHHSDLSIDEVAEECGFSDRAYFSRIFARKRRVSPAAFRKRQRPPEG